MQIIISLLLNALAVYITAAILPGVHISSLVNTLVIAVVLGLVNTFIKPVITIFALPFTIVTLGLFSFVISGLMVLLVSKLVPGFTVDNFLWAMAFALVLSIVNSFLGMFK
jgi:putative membrane protein